MTSPWVWAGPTSVSSTVRPPLSIRWVPRNSTVGAGGSMSEKSNAPKACSM